MYPNPQEKSDLDSKFKDWIAKAEREHDDFVNDMNKADDYFDGLQVPTGFSEEHKVALSKANDPSALQTTQSYVVVNQIAQTHDNILGNFIRAKQTVNVYPRSPKDIKKIIPIRKSLQFIEDKNNSFTRVLFPALDHMLHSGLDWGKLWYDPYDQLPNGSIKEARISARDVLVDFDSRDPFYEDTQFRAHRIRYNIEDAKEEFKRIEGFDSSQLKPDMDWVSGVPQTSNNQGMGRYCTIYEIQLRKRETVYRKVEGNNVIDIDEEEYQKLSQDEKNADLVFADRDEVYYTAYWNKTFGTFYYRKSSWQCFTLIPLINRRSENRVYPIGDFLLYANLQDLFNVIVSLILDDAKQGRKWIIGVDPMTYTTYGDAIQQAIDEGKNIVPIQQGMQSIKPPGVSEGVLTLMSLVKGFIDSIRALPSVSRGELPSRQISEKTVETLISSALTSHGRKDIMINYFLTEMAKARYKIMKAMWDQQDWVRVTDAQPGMPQFVPINLVIEGDEGYNDLLAKMSGIDFPQGQVPPEQAQEFLVFKKKFERENDIFIEQKERVRYNGSKGNPVFTDEEYEGHIQQSGMTPSEFVNKFNVERIPVNIYKINMLSTDSDIDIQYVVDFDIEKKKGQRQAMSMRLGEMGWQTPVDTMEDLEIEDAEGRYQRAQEANQTVQIATRIKKDKKFSQAVNLAQQLASDKSLMDGVQALLQRVQEQKIENLSQAK